MLCGSTVSLATTCSRSLRSRAVLAYVLSSTGTGVLSGADLPAALLSEYRRALRSRDTSDHGPLSTQSSCVRNRAEAEPCAAAGVRGNWAQQRGRPHLFGKAEEGVGGAGAVGMGEPYRVRLFGVRLR